MKTAYDIRAQAADACRARFEGRPLIWGKVDCWQITAHNLRKLGISTALVKGLTYSTEAGAAKTLRRLGFHGLGELMDALGEPFRIAPALATQGDVIGFECAGGLWDMALSVSAGNGNVLGIGENYGRALVMRPDLSGAVAAWRCNPCRK